MSLLHDLSLLNRSGMAAFRATQRDWSPYLVHFTSWTAMKEVRELLDKPNISTSDIADCLDKSDKISFGVAKRILDSGHVLPSKLNTKNSPTVVCLSECTLPGLFCHAERFGRFGFVFDKAELFKIGARPCLYMEADQRRTLIRNCSDLIPIANVYRPKDGKIQDYMMEREWRSLVDIPLSMLKGIIRPDAYSAEVCGLVNNDSIPVFPIDMLYAWGV